MSRRPYFKLYGSDFFDGCRKGGLTLEEVGLYVGVLWAMWEAGGDISADPKALSFLVGADQRKVRHVLTGLIRKGKIEEAEGRLRNARMVSEITKYTETVKAASKRERQKRDPMPDIPATQQFATPADTPRGTEGGSYRGTSAHLSENTNNINDGASQKKAGGPPYTRSHIEKGSYRDRFQPTTTVPPSTSVLGPDGPSGLVDLGGDFDPVRVNGSKVYVTIGERTETIPKQAMRDIGWRAGKLPGDDAISVGVAVCWKWVEDGTFPEKPLRALEGWMRTEIKREAERKRNEATGFMSEADAELERYAARGRAMRLAREVAP